MNQIAPNCRFLLKHFQVGPRFGRDLHDPSVISISRITCRKPRRMAIHVWILNPPNPTSQMSIHSICQATVRLVTEPQARQARKISPEALLGPLSQLLYLFACYRGYGAVFGEFRVLRFSAGLEAMGLQGPWGPWVAIALRRLRDCYRAPLGKSPLDVSSFS